MLTEELRHRHTGLGGDGEKIKYQDIEGAPSNLWCSGTKSTQTTVAGGSTIALDTYTGNGAMAATAGRITIIETGNYFCSATIKITAENTAGTTFIYIKKNGTTNVLTGYNYSAVGPPTGATTNGVLELVAGDYLEIIETGNSVLDIIPGGIDGNRLFVKKL